MKKIMFIITILWMGFIFYNSATPGTLSNYRSNEVVTTFRSGQHLINGSNKLYSNTTNQKMNFFIRKNAHAFEYMVLAIILAIYLKVIGIKGKNSFVYIMFICLLYAVTDEYHQSFVPERTSLVSDVLIDFLGCIIGILFYSGASFIMRKRKELLWNKKKSF